MGVSPVIFWILTLVVIVSALAVVMGKNIVHSALLLIVTFLGVAGVYMLLEADFLALVQVLVYAGAIAVLLVFGVMLTRRGEISESNLFNKNRLVGGIVALGLFLTIERLILTNSWSKEVVFSGSTSGLLAEAMLGEYVIPFEVAALLLLVGMLGAIILAKGVKSEQ